MKKTYTGSCHCGAVRFECDLDLAAGTSRCNCSVCAKGRFWKAVVPARAFRIRQGEGALSEYTFASRSIHHFFCKRCGIKPFGRGHLDEIGDFVAVNVACLDDVTDEQLARAPVQYEDGRNDRWESPPIETRHL
jgi:hypothetical protein